MMRHTPQNSGDQCPAGQPPVAGRDLAVLTRVIMDDPRFRRVIEAAVRAQALVPGSVAVGGTAAALYAGHRISLDSDHIVPNLDTRFDEVAALLSATEGWTLARVDPPKLILGSLDGAEVGFRQPIRKTPIETAMIDTPYGRVCVPTLDEMTGIKAWLAYRRNVTRDYIDFVALASIQSDEQVLKSLLKLDERYYGLQSSSVAKSVAERLVAPLPRDLDEASLGEYKGLKSELADWKIISSRCKELGAALGARLVEK